jgi:hypothetical protein
MHVMVNEKRFWSRMNAGVGNAAQARCRVASAIKKNVPDERTPCVGGQEEQTTDSMSRVKLKLCADIARHRARGAHARDKYGRFIPYRFAVLPL